jgi:hypothetical protein
MILLGCGDLPEYSHHLRHLIQMNGSCWHCARPILGSHTRSHDQAIELTDHIARSGDLAKKLSQQDYWLGLLAKRYKCVDRVLVADNPISGENAFLVILGMLLHSLSLYYRCLCANGIPVG